MTVLRPRVLTLLMCTLCLLPQPETLSAEGKWFTTYYSTWSMMPLGTSELALPPWEIDWTGLTHVVLFDNGNVTKSPPYWAYMFGPPPKRPSDTESDSVSVEFNGVAFPGSGAVHYMDSLVAIAHRRGVKVVITIQAVNPVNLNYVAADSLRTEVFVNTVASWAERKGFDGVELDWEGWASPLPPASTVNRFVRMLYRRIHSMKTRSGAPGLIMISAGSGHEDLYDPSQDFMVDQFNLQLYDYSYAWYAKIGSNASWYLAPLHRGTVDPTFEGQAYDTRGPLQWVAAGHDAKRIGLGVPIFGTILRNVDGLFQKMASDGDYGNAHYQTVEALKEIGGVEEWDDARKVHSIRGTALRSNGRPVYYQSDGVNAGQKFFASGETPMSLREKISWMNQNNFGGIMTYEFVSDLDWRQTLASGKRHPLHRVIASSLSSGPQHVPPSGVIEALPAHLPSSGGEVTLKWNSTDAVSAAIDQGVGVVALNGSRTVSVTQTTTFTLMLAGGAGASARASAAVTVSAPPPVGMLRCEPAALSAGGGKVTLVWTSTDAVRASIDHGIGDVAVNGSLSVSVKSSTDFTLTLANADGMTSQYRASVRVDTIAVHTVGLLRGWNMISSYVLPDSVQLARIGMELDSTQCVLKDGQGGVYWPRYAINTLGSWDPRKGYLFFTETDRQLKLSGTLIDPVSHPLALSRGMNMVPYLKRTPMDALSAFGMLSDSLIIVSDMRGRLYWPSKKIFTLETLMPGEAYLVYVSAPATFIYPEDALPSASVGRER
ncbi:MAG: glycosyl hydrolase family 18 protein [Acidobacteriota bacterium]